LTALVGILQFADTPVNLTGHRLTTSIAPNAVERS
jgi:hypothetical protein